MKRLAHRVVCILFFVFALVLPAAMPRQAVAQQPTVDAAALKAKGDEAMLNLQYQEALDQYERAFAISKDPALHYNRGRALAALNRFPEALQMFESFEREAPEPLKAKVPDLADFVNQMRQRVATLTIRLKRPVAATVRLGAVVLGTVPLEKRAVNAGRTKLVITAEGHEALEQEVDLPGGKETSLVFDLVPKDRRGTLVVKSVTGASVSVDGKPSGDVPAEVRVDPGSHEITVDHPDYYSSTSKVEVGVGERREVDFPLEPVPAVYETWWFWTIIGGVVVAGSVVAIAVPLTTEKGPGEGTIDPGQIVIRPEHAIHARQGVNRAAVPGIHVGASPTGAVVRWAWQF